MEHITRQQTILIALLVAIVTSVATAITVVSLTDETSTPTQTIYRVIEKSIDKVADIPAVKEVKEVVKDSPKKEVTIFSPAAIAESGAKSLVRIYDKGSGDKKFAALGIAVGSKDGVLASALLVPNSPASSYVVVAPDGTEVEANFTKGDVAGGFTFFTLKYSDPKKKVPSVDLKNIGTVKLGDNIVILGGKEGGNVVSTGIVSELRPIDGKDGDKPSEASYIITDVSLSSSVSGFLLFDTEGHLVALEQGIGESDKTPTFIPIGLIKASLSTLL